MTDIANNTTGSPGITETDHGLNQRIFRVMAAVTAFAIAISALVGPWRFTMGLLIGGLLALFSHNWLRNSASAAINLAVGKGVQQIRLFKFLLRYVVVGSVVFAAYQAGIASLSAMLIGLSSFVVALFAEASREFYIAIIHREEIS